MATNSTTAPDSAPPTIHVAPGPHVVNQSDSTRRMMIDVLIGLIPVTIASVAVFQLHAVKIIALCVASCVAAEAIFTRMRNRPLPIRDGSAVVTGMILAFSLPATCPWWVAVIGSFAAIGLGKVVFGGVGMNIFNPAMVGRAFVMIAFAWALGAGAYVDPASSVHAITRATPMTHAFKGGAVESGLLLKLFLGNTNGCLGETSALACLIGGAWLLVRRSASWRIPAGAIVGLGLVAGLANLLNPSAQWTVLHHLFGGAFLLGALFILTDPVSSPVTRKGRFLFGLGFGVLVMLIRLLTNYPEGVMFSVLLMNAVAPLINRWTVPRPVGGPVPEPKKA